MLGSSDPVLACGHAFPDAHRACAHVASGAIKKGVRQFTGQGLELAYVCTACLELQLPPSELVCASCIAALTREVYWHYHGLPGIVHKPKPFRFSRRHIELRGPAPADILQMQPLFNHPTDTIVVGNEGEVCRIDLDSGVVSHIATLDSTQVPRDGAISLVLSRDHRFAAITSCSRDSAASAYNKGVVIDLVTGKEVMPLDCGDYRVNHTPFPVTFAEHRGETLLVHATDWNRLDVTNPSTGQRLTDRDFDTIEKDENFYDNSTFSEWHGELLTSPDQQHVATIGWVWHPVGVAFSFSLARWLNENVWEPDNGPSKHSYCIWDYFWQGPFLWRDSDTLCLWGAPDLQIGSDVPLDSVALYDIHTEAQIRQFAGPTLDIFFLDRYLFSGLPEQKGISIWDLDDGTLLYSEEGIKPFAYHSGSKTFVGRGDSGLVAWQWQEL